MLVWGGRSAEHWISTHQAAHGSWPVAARQAFYPASTEPLGFPSDAGAPTVRNVRGPAETHAGLQAGAAGAVWRRWAPCSSRPCSRGMWSPDAMWPWVRHLPVLRLDSWLDNWLTPSPTPPRSCWLSRRPGRRRPGCGGTDAGQDGRRCGPHAGWSAVGQVLHCMQPCLQP